MHGARPAVPHEGPSALIRTECGDTLASDEFRPVARSMPGRARPPRRHGKVLAVNAGGGIIAIHAYLGASGHAPAPPLAAHIIILSTGHAAMSKRRGQALPSQANHPVVGIGASAGGLSALLEFFEALPARTSMAFVVVMHLAPDHESNLASLLQKATGMRVMEVTSPTPIEPDHVYLIAPSSNDDGRRLSARRPHRPEEWPPGGHRSLSGPSRKPTANARSASCCPAQARTAPSGCRGSRKWAASRSQEPAEAEYDSMPRSIATGMVDFVTTAAEMPLRLMDLWVTAKEIHLPVNENEERQEELVNGPPSARCARS